MRATLRATIHFNLPIVSAKKKDWSFYSCLFFLIVAFADMIKEGVIIPNAYFAIIFAFGAGWNGANLKNNR